MKKIVSYATIVFWISFTMLVFNSEPSDGWEIFIIIVCSVIIQWGSTPNSKIKPECYYKLEKVVPHTDGSCSIVLSYDNNVETYKCEEIYASSNPQIGNQYLIEIKNGVIFFIPT